MMTEMLRAAAPRGRPADERFLHLVKGEDARSAGRHRERLDAMGGISEFPMRVKCAPRPGTIIKMPRKREKSVEEGAT
jgi:hypothetical protein